MGNVSMWLQATRMPTESSQTRQFILLAAYSTEIYFTSAYSAAAYSAGVYSVEVYSKAVYSTAAYSAGVYSVEVYSTAAYSAGVYSVEVYSAAIYFYSSLFCRQNDAIAKKKLENMNKSH
jgi:hypothetical protein